MTKTYPWNATKHAHDIEYRHTRCFNEMRGMEVGEIPWDDRTYDELSRLHDALDDLLDVCMGGGIVWLTGKQFGLARECELWATTQRGGR